MYIPEVQVNSKSDDWNATNLFIYFFNDCFDNLSLALHKALIGASNK